MTYTKGPWRIKHSESKSAFNVVGTHLGGTYKIARCPYLEVECFCAEEINERAKKEAEANANLIAAAPELLEALEMLLAEYNDTSVQMNTPIAYFKGFSKAEAVIAKAKGGAQ